MKFNRPRNPRELKCSIAINELGTYCIPDSTSFEGCGEIVGRGIVYEGCTNWFVRENCGDGDIVHAGTFFGDMLPSFSEKCKGRVWAFEPVEENFRCAEITCKLNGGLSNVFLSNMGLGAHSGKLVIQTGRKSGAHLGGCARIKEVDEGCDSETIHITTIDETVPEQRDVSIIHLDVEGHEAEALLGGLKTIDRCKPILLCEVVQETAYDPKMVTENQWFIDNIFSRGYQVADFDGVWGDKGFKGRVHGNIVLVHPDRPYKKYIGANEQV